MKLFNTDFHQVVGIVRNSKYRSLGSDSPPILYRPLTQVYQSNLALLIRSKNPDAVIGTVRSQLRQLDEKLPITNVSTLSDVLDSALWAPRMAAWLLTLLGGVSLLLAVVGIYGVMAYSVSLRTRELGIRVALGALRRDVIRLVVGQSLRLSFIGMTAGLGVSLIAARFIGVLLCGGALDPVTFVSVPLVLAVAVVVASYASRSPGNAHRTNDRAAIGPVIARDRDFTAKALPLLFLPSRAGLGTGSRAHHVSNRSRGRGELTMFMPRWTPSAIFRGVQPFLLGRFHTSILAPSFAPDTSRPSARAYARRRA